MLLVHRELALRLCCGVCSACGASKAKLDAALKSTSRRRQQALRIPLVWSDDEKSGYIMMLERIGASTPLAFTDPVQQICVFSDASYVGYTIVVAQVADWKNDSPIHE